MFIERENDKIFAKGTPLELASWAECGESNDVESIYIKTLVQLELDSNPHAERVSINITKIWNAC